MGSSYYLVVLGLVSPIVAEITCGVAHGYDRGTNAFYYSGDGSLSNFDACSAQCQTMSQCQSFAFGDSQCLLYAAPLDTNFRQQENSPFLFYDRDCMDVKATSSFLTSLPPATAATTVDAAASTPSAATTTTNPAAGAASPTPSATGTASSQEADSGGSSGSSVSSDAGGAGAGAATTSGGSAVAANTGAEATASSGAASKTAASKGASATSSATASLQTGAAASFGVPGIELSGRWLTASVICGLLMSWA